MKRTKIMYALIPLFVAIALPIGAFASEKTGTTAASFLKIGIGARAVAMGDAFTAVANDSTAIYWNPAGLSQLKRMELIAQHNIWLDDLRHEFLGYVHPTSYGNFGCALSYFHMGQIQETTMASPSGTGRTFTNYDLLGVLSYSRKVNESLSFGTNLKYLNQTLENHNASSYMADLGLLYRPSRLGFGLGVFNLGKGVKFIKDEFPLPILCKAGVSYGMEKLTLALDANKPTDGRLYFSAGAEVKPFGPLAVRLGWKDPGDHRGGTSRRIPTGLSAGAGISFRDIQFDYAYVPYGDLGDTHWGSLLVRFGKDTEHPKPETKTD